jgi:aspartyl-tRNA(Asn)/glutamyl-tRNA(Gln) amidotransferase subunit A
MRTIHATAREIRQGRITPADVLEECLACIDRYEPRVRAWVLIDRDGAREQACILTEELRRGQDRGPLHGIPLGIKDIIDVEGWPTAAASELWKNSIARQDATVVRRLRQAGAILLGKTVTTQYASFDPPPTRNPWDLSRTPGGSSSGSAAALACGMCLGAIGSQTGGSITRPASYCGVAGLKPSYGNVSLEGILPLAPSMDHPGPLAACVTDLAILYDAIADLTFHREAFQDGKVLTDSGSPPHHLGRVYGLFHDRAEPVMRSLVEKVCRQFAQAGAPVTEANLPTGFGEVIPRHRTIMAVEAAAFHESRLKQHSEDYGPAIRALLQEGLSCPAPEYVRCLKHKHELTVEMSDRMAGLGALVTPATLGPAPDAGTTGDPAFNSPWSYTGLPTVSIPAGWTPEGLPLAIQLVGSSGSDSELLGVGAWCERVLAVERREPPL